MHAMAMITRLDECLERAADPVACFNFCVHAMASGQCDDLACDEIAQLGTSRAALRACALATPLLFEPPTDMASVAAARKQVSKSIKTPLGGEEVLVVPRGTRKGFDADPRAPEWYEASRAAFFDTILVLPGNKMVLEEWALAMGYEIIPMTTSCDVKVERDTGLLGKLKVRHSVDQAQQHRRGSAATRQELDSMPTSTTQAHDFTIKCFASSLEPDEVITCADYPGAYGVGGAVTPASAVASGQPVARGLEPGEHGGICRRAARVCRIPETVDAFDEQGRRLVLWLASSLWGEGVAGYEWDVVRDEDLLAVGWPMCQGTYGAYSYMAMPHLGRAIVIVDDLCFITKGDASLALRTIDALSDLSEKRGGKRLTVKMEAPRMAFGGVALTRSADKRTLTLTLTNHIEQSVRRWLPSVVEDGSVPKGVPKGKELRTLLESLELAPVGTAMTKEMRDVASIVGDLRWMLRVLLRLVRHVQMLSRVAARPVCPDAKRAALGVLLQAWHYRDEGITYGGAFGAPVFTGVLSGSADSPRGASIATKEAGVDVMAAGAPRALVGAGDATWGKLARGPDDVKGEPTLKPADEYAFVLTHNGGAVALELKLIKLAMGCSGETEGYASLRCSDKLMEGRVCLANFGRPQHDPTLLLSDNDANLRIAAGEASAQRLRHALRRWWVVTARVRGRELRLGHLPDGDNYIDYATKFVSKDKEDASVAYISNSRSRAAHGDAVAEAVACVVSFDVGRARA